MKKLFLVCALITSICGCAINTTPLTRDQVAAKVAVKTGYAGCNGCNMVRTYVAPHLYWKQFVNDPDFHGWLDLNLQLASTDYNIAGHAQAYRIVTGVIANGGFQDAWRTHVPLDPQDRCPSDAEVVRGYRGFHTGNGIEFWLVKDDGTYVPLGHVADSNGETIKDLECFSNVGSGASWTQMVDLPAKAVEDAWRQNRAIRIFAGRALTKYASTSDGYNPVTLAHTVRKGVLLEFSSDYVGGFADGLKRLGAAMPAAS
ncbi:hypothetical protein LJ655_08215 [Paraburkholderia sp. MMS20-SJTN17]|uniref:Lipoprotein n=1 Tax=Paraburkholderia translucens TaxID=2886945 RepID=A0ABS8KAW7_9BURK|nr:hypothetical protein [Paraburkholderia sp. MMS20-SJTN17]MCC8401875.1 hypothetical protein [Paraburkholderia sp. MMS20-SJTN17]